MDHGNGNGATHAPAAPDTASVKEVPTATLDPEVIRYLVRLPRVIPNMVKNHLQLKTTVEDRLDAVAAELAELRGFRRRMEDEQRVIREDLQQTHNELATLRTQIQLMRDELANFRAVVEEGFKRAELQLRVRPMKVGRKPQARDEFGNRVPAPIGCLIPAALEKTGLSIQQLAALMEVTPRAIRMWIKMERDPKGMRGTRLEAWLDSVETADEFRIQNWHTDANRVIHENRAGKQVAE